jgi:hypothetical protein
MERERLTMETRPWPRIGFILLGAWLIAAAAMQILPALGPLGLLMPALQLIAGIFIIIGR